MYTKKPKKQHIWSSLPLSILNMAPSHQCEGLVIVEHVEHGTDVSITNNLV
jgi:hypothetical protein